MKKKRVAVKGGLHRIGRRQKPLHVSGVIRPETDTLKLPTALEGETVESVLPHKVVLVIVLLWLLFVAIITWFVAHMPLKTG
jgi:hypothetical protein